MIILTLKYSITFIRILTNIHIYYNTFLFSLYHYIGAKINKALLKILLNFLIVSRLKID